MDEIADSPEGLELSSYRLPQRANNYGSFSTLTPLAVSGEFPHRRWKLCVPMFRLQRGAAKGTLYEDRIEQMSSSLEISLSSTEDGELVNGRNQTLDKPSILGCFQ